MDGHFFISFHCKAALHRFKWKQLCEPHVKKKKNISLIAFLKGSKIVFSKQAHDIQCLSTKFTVYTYLHIIIVIESLFTIGYLCNYPGRIIWYLKH